MKRFDVSELVEASEQEPIEVRKLKKRINEMLHLLEEGQTLELIRHGKVFVRVKSESEEKPSREQKIKAFLADMDQLAAQIGAQWEGNMSAVDAVRDVRRDL